MATIYSQNQEYLLEITVIVVSIHCIPLSLLGLLVMTKILLSLRKNYNNKKSRLQYCHVTYCHVTIENKITKLQLILQSHPAHDAIKHLYL